MADAKFPRRHRVRPHELPFGGVRFFPQPNEGLWKVAGVTYRDEIVVYRVITTDPAARSFLSDLKSRLKRDLEQAEILIIARGIETL